MKFKLYGYFINGRLIKISSDKELLQELWMDDYFEEAYYQYNVITQTYIGYRNNNQIISPYEFWKDIKNKVNTRYSNRISYRQIIDMAQYYIE